MAVIGGALKEVEDDLGPMFAQPIDQRRRVLANAQPGDLKPGRFEVAGHFIGRVENLVLRLVIGMPERQNRLVVQHQHPRRHTISYPL